MSAMKKAPEAHPNDVIVHTSRGPHTPGKTHGTPPAVGRDHEGKPAHVCPECRSSNLQEGYGIGCGPGIGLYWFCHECDWTHKVEDS